MYGRVQPVLAETVRPSTSVVVCDGGLTYMVVCSLCWLRPSVYQCCGVRRGVDMYGRVQPVLVETVRLPVLWCAAGG